MLSQVRRFLGAFAVLTLFAVVAACGGDDDAGETSEGDTDAPTDGSADSDDQDLAAAACGPLEETAEIVLSTPVAIMAFAPVLLGIENGAFAEANLDVKIENLQATESQVPLYQGSIDGHLTSYSAPYFNAVNSGVDIRWVAPMYAVSEDTGVGYWARTDVVGDAEEPDIEALAGTSIASPSGLLAAGGLILSEILETGGVSMSDVTLQRLGGPDALVGLENGAVAGAWLSDPFWNDAVDNPDLRYLGGYEPESINGSGIVVGTRLLDRPEVLGTFLRVISEQVELHLSGDDYLADDEVAGHLANAIGTTPEELRQGDPLIFDSGLDMAGAAEFLDRLQTVMIDNDVLDYAEPKNVEDLVDTSFVETAVGCG